MLLCDAPGSLIVNEQGAAQLFGKSDSLSFSRMESIGELIHKYAVANLHAPDPLGLGHLNGTRQSCPLDNDFIVYRARNNECSDDIAEQVEMLRSGKGE
jgi:hypothetical protein